MIECIGKVDSVDSVICPFERCVFPIADGSVRETSENRLTVDFINRQIQLPNLTLSVQFLPSSVDDRFIRYAAFIVAPDYNTGSNEMHVIALSMWRRQNKDIHNIYLVMNQSDALLLMNAVSRLISKQSMTKAHEFYPLVTGRVLVSNCTSIRHSESNPDCCSPQSLMFFILDAESLSFFEHDFSNNPTYDFRFYKEKGPRAIDVIFVSKDFSNIHLRQGSQVCIIRKNVNSDADKKSYDMLLNMLKENVIKPKPEEYFMSHHADRNLDEALQFDHDLRKSRDIGSVPFSASDGRDPENFNISTWEPQQSEFRWQKVDDQYEHDQWMNNLYTGHHIDSNLDEAMQLMWCTFEHDLRECIAKDTVPFTAADSGGLDPDSSSHLQRSVEDIKDQLLNNNMVLALSRLQACQRIFKNTLLQPVSKLDQVELMKRIYFLSGRN